MIESFRPPGGEGLGTVLLVGDAPEELRVLGELVTSLGYGLIATNDPAQALTLVSLRAFDAIVTDIHSRLPSGGLFAVDIAFVAPEVPLVVVTGHESLQEIWDLLGAGRADAIIPAATCESGLHHALGRAIGRGRNLARSEQSARLVADGLVRALALRDVETEGHSRRVAAWTLMLAQRLGTPRDEWIHVELGALLHDIGKIGVSDVILRKAGKLSASEWAEMRRHPELGYAIISDIPALGGAVDVVRSHHERWEGGGYPEGISGEDIPFHARMFALVDTYDALTSDRPYRRGRSYEDAVNVIRTESAAQFDPRVVEAFLWVPPEEWQLVSRTFSDHGRVGQPPPPPLELASIAK